jgi:hypothetical protein
VYYANDPGYGTLEMQWAQLLGEKEVFYWAAAYAYWGIGMDALAKWGDNSANNKNANLVVFYEPPSNGSLSAGVWYSQYNTLIINCWGLPSVNETDGWKLGSTIAHEATHMYFSAVTGKGITKTTEGYWANLMTESLAHYVGNVLWPSQCQFSGSEHGGYNNWPMTSWDVIGKATKTDWGWSSGGFNSGKMGTWYDIASTYNFGGTYNNAERDHFWATGFYLCNYWNPDTGYTGLFHSAGWSTWSQYGMGGSHNVAAVLYLVKSSGTNWTFVDALQYVYGKAVGSLSDMSGHHGNLNGIYYWYWQYLDRYV